MRAVSYTHLDVYKRQVMGRDAARNVIQWAIKSYRENFKDGVKIGK